jgi:cytochrome c oxidase subunit 4
MGLSYEEGKKVVVKGMWLLAAVTLVEVAIALLGNGHLISGFTLPKIIMYPAMIGLSLYKAYFIIYEFMHLRYEVKGMAMSILLPTLLLVWGIIAFMQEGSSWGSRRSQIEQKNSREITNSAAPEGIPADTKIVE